MKLLLVLCAVIALTTAAPEEASFEPYDQEAGLESAQSTPLKKGIYYIGNGRVFRFNADGTHQGVSSGPWGGTTCMANYGGNRIFAVWLDNIYEVYETSWKSFGAGYSSASALVQLGNYMYTTIGNKKCGHLYRISIQGTVKATMEKYGTAGIYSLGLAAAYGGEYIIGAETHWTIIGKNGDSTTMTKGSCTAITTTPDGAVYAITPEGEIHWINANDGTTYEVVVNGDLFKGSRGIAYFDKYLYAIGKNGRFYRINPNNGEAKIHGTSSGWEVAGKMASIN